MGIMDFFRSAPASDAPTVVVQTAPAATTPSNPAVGPDGKMPGTNQEPVNPLDAYAKMFEKVETKPEDAPPSFNLDPKVLSDVSGKLNFTQDIPPELMQAATSGDANAMIQMMNLVGQKAYSAAMSHGSSLTDKFVGARTEHAMKNVGSHVKSEMTQAALASVPNYDHPVVKEQLRQLATNFSAQHPDATPDQVAQMSIKYLQDLTAAISPASKTESPATAAETDWNKWFA